MSLISNGLLSYSIEVSLGFTLVMGPILKWILKKALLIPKKMYFSNFESNFLKNRLVYLMQ